MVNKVLLADDSATIQKLVEMALSDSDFDLLAVSDGKQAVDKLPEFQPDIILADAIMPALNGYEVCRHVKTDGATRHIPVILLTGRFQPYDKEMAEEVGVDEKIVKPFSQEQLVSVMRRLIDNAAPAPVPVERAQDVEPAPNYFDEGATIQANPDQLRASLQMSPEAEEEDVPDIDAFSLDDAEDEEPMELHTEDLEELGDDDLGDPDDDAPQDLDDDELQGLDDSDDELELSDADMIQPDQMAETLELSEVPEIEAMPESDPLSEPEPLTGFEDTADIVDGKHDNADELGDDDFQAEELTLDDSLDLGDDSLDITDDSLEMTDDSLEELDADDFAALDEDTQPITPDQEETTQPVAAAELDPLPTTDEVDFPMMVDTDEDDNLMLEDDGDTATLPGEITLEEMAEAPEMPDEAERIVSEADTVQITPEEVDRIRETSLEEQEALSEDDFDLDLSDEAEDDGFSVEEIAAPLLPDEAENVIVPPAPEAEPALASEPDAITDFTIPDAQDEPILEEVALEEPEPLVLETDDADVLEVEEEPAAAPVAASSLNEAVAAAAGPLSLSDTQMDALAEKVAANLVKSVGSDYVREVIWQVVPELAEAMIKKRIYQLERSVDD